MEGARWVGLGGRAVALAPREPECRRNGWVNGFGGLGGSWVWRGGALHLRRWGWQVLALASHGGEGPGLVGGELCRSSYRLAELLFFGLARAVGRWTTRQDAMLGAALTARDRLAFKVLLGCRA